MTKDIKLSVWRRIRNALKYWRRRTNATIDLATDGFVFTYNRKTTEMRWNDISRIDAGVLDAFTVDVFYAVLFTANLQITIDEFTDGFQTFEREIFTRWPQIREQWVALYTGPALQPRYENLWMREN